ncbi:MAG: PEP/pyruvate-binding domain-containing protein [Anaerolineales bacterium]
MNHVNHIIELNSKEINNHIGNKARNLIHLKRMSKLHIPRTWIIPWYMQELYQNQPKTTTENLIESLNKIFDQQKLYAVRSSSNFEDAHFHSFAGLFTTYLNVQGTLELQNRIIDVWRTSDSEAVRNYLDKFDLSPNDIKMAVIIQEMVEPIFSGVCFSVNPMTGSSEIVIEAVPGEGTALVQDGVTPERWISRSGSWIARPEDKKLPVEVANQIISDTKKIVKKIKKPIDLEWVYDGQNVNWVQMREITTLEDLSVYSNRLSKDMMPGIIHPLIWSINVPLINTVWLGLLEEMVGSLPIKPEELAKSFYYRSYFNMGAIGQVFSTVGLPSEGLEMMMGIVPKQEGRPMMKPNLQMMRHIPRMLTFLYDKWNFERKLKHTLPELEAKLARFSLNPDGSIEEIIDNIHDLFDLVQKTVYFNVITPLLVSMYARVLESQLKKQNVDMMQFELSENMPKLNEYNPNVALAKIKKQYDQLSQSEKDQLTKEVSLNQHENGTTNGFHKSLAQFIENFGHLSDNSNNFTAQPWRENPSFVINMIREYEDITRPLEKRIRFDDLQTKGLRKGLLKLFYNRARKYIIYREQVSRDYVYGYGLFRTYFFAVAKWMIERKWLVQPEDIFFLTWDEIQKAVSDKVGEHLMTVVKRRSAEMEKYRDIILPDVIYGDEPPPVYSESYDRMHGTPTSQGYYVGSAKVIFGREDFDKVEQGDVIVIPYSDVGWTPLFARAGAVIAESGGILSHSSIIAREYQIPAVVSVSNCMRLKDQQKVSVNGFTGEIVLLDQEQV